MQILKNDLAFIILLHQCQFKILLTLIIIRLLLLKLYTKLIILILLQQNCNLSLIKALARLIRFKALFKFCKCSNINQQILRSFNSLLQSVYSPFTLILSINSIAIAKNKSFKIVIITCINQATKLVAPCNRVVILSKLRRVIKAIISLLLTFKIN